MLLEIIIVPIVAYIEDGGVEVIKLAAQMKNISFDIFQGEEIGALGIILLLLWGLDILNSLIF